GPLSSSDLISLAKLTRFYTSLRSKNQSKDEQPSTEVIDSHRQYLNGLLNKLRKEELNEHDPMSTSLPESSPIGLSKYKQESQEADYPAHLGELSPLEVIDRLSTGMDQKSERYYNNSKTPENTLNFLNSSQLLDRMGQADLQNLDFDTVSLLLNQLQTQGASNLLPSFPGNAQQQIYDQVYGLPQ
ncbi:unnamed protein product, partial [Meganyctiphanes norvegica]